MSGRISPETVTQGSEISGTVYLIGRPDQDGPVKIGFTRRASAARRLTELRGRPPGTSGSVLAPDGLDLKTLEILATVPATLDIEKEVLSRLSGRRIVGEWFSLRAGEVAEVAGQIEIMAALGTTRREQPDRAFSWPTGDPVAVRRMRRNQGSYYSV
jgi:hypothetical protein